MNNKVVNILNLLVFIGVCAALGFLLRQVDANHRLVASIAYAGVQYAIAFSGLVFGLLVVLPLLPQRYGRNSKTLKVRNAIVRPFVSLVPNWALPKTRVSGLSNDFQRYPL